MYNGGKILLHYHNKPTNLQWWHGVRLFALTTGGPVIFLVLHTVYTNPLMGRYGAVVLALTWMVGCGVLPRWPSYGQVLCSIALVTTVGFILLQLMQAPGRVLICLVMTTLVGFWIWSPVSSVYKKDLVAVDVKISALGVFVIWILSDPVGLVTSWFAFAFVVLTGVASLGMGVVRRQKSLTWRVPTWCLWSGIVMVVIGMMAIGLTSFGVGLRSVMLIAVWLYVLVRSSGKRDDLWERLALHPGRFLVMTFLFLCLIGGVLLALPISAASDQGIAFTDALFTAVSATCVTGLIVLDTPVDFSIWGQGFILLLIQVGGLGIMTFYAAAVSVLGYRMSLREEHAAVVLLGGEGRNGILAALRGILWVTVVAELVGALMLTYLFWSVGDGVGQALWRGIFTAISAYCNAGFALQSDSLIPYQTQPAILYVVSLLIVIGGLGPAVVLSLQYVLARRRVSLHVKIVISVTCILLVVPAVLFTAFEWSHTLDHMSWWLRLAHGWFQSVTTRTAGFNAIDLSVAHPATLTLTSILMFIGGSPGSTAGGIKTTTLMVVFLVVMATLRGRKEVHIFGWHIPLDSVHRAVTIFFLSILGVLLAVLALLLTQNLSFLQVVFEVISALGTVGLSVGATGDLDSVGKVIIMVCMFIGRVGLLTLLLSLSEPEKRFATLPEQDVIVG